MAVQDTGTVRIGDYVSSDGSVISFINISRVTVQDGGKYECRATNDFGMDAHSSWINVIGSPYIKPMKNLTVVAGETILIECPVSSSLVTSIIWFKG